MNMSILCSMLCQVHIPGEDRGGHPAGGGFGLPGAGREVPGRAAQGARREEDAPAARQGEHGEVPHGRRLIQVIISLMIIF